MAPYSLPLQSPLEWIFVCVVALPQTFNQIHSKKVALVMFSGCFGWFGSENPGGSPHIRKFSARCVRSGGACSVICGDSGSIMVCGGSRSTGPGHDEPRGLAPALQCTGTLTRTKELDSPAPPGTNCSGWEQTSRFRWPLFAV